MYILYPFRSANIIIEEIVSGESAIETDLLSLYAFETFRSRDFLLLFFSPISS